jgi:hypothetical protein
MRTILGVVISCALFLVFLPSFISAQTVVGDANNDGKVDGIDFSIWLLYYNQPVNDESHACDFDKSGFVDGVDFSIWLSHYNQTVTATPTRSTQPTVTHAPTPSGPAPTNPPIGETDGIWISTAEIMALPITGSAWSSVQAAANSSWGSACLNDNNCPHDVHTLAGALVAVRTNNAAMRTKTIGGLQSAMGSNLSRALELSRGLQTYIIAADIIGYHEPAFEAWVREMLTVNVSGHSGTGVQGTAYNASNNWGGHARASVAAGALYLNDTAMLGKLVTAHKAFIGLPAPGNTMVYNDTTWHADPGNKAGVNRKGSVHGGVNISGVLPEDWRRADYDFKWPPTPTGYMWEGIQGYIVASVILHRAGVLPITSSDNALMRAMDILYHKGEALGNPAWTNAASGDDTWIPWVANYYLNENRYPTTAATPGKNMGWTDWTHAR